MDSSRRAARCALGTAVLAAAAACAGPSSPPEPAPAAAAERPAGQPAAPCEEERVAAKLLVLAVPGMDEAAAQRVEQALADRFADGLVAAVANRRNGLVTILARPDAGFTEADALDLFQTLGLDAREASQEERQAAQAALASEILVIPAARASSGPPAGEGSATGFPLQALDESVAPLRKRFNDARGKLRFIAVLSPT